MPQAEQEANFFELVAMVLVVVTASVYLPSSEMCITFFLNVVFLVVRVVIATRLVISYILDDVDDGLVLYSIRNYDVDRIDGVANYGDSR